MSQRLTRSKLSLSSRKSIHKQIHIRRISSHIHSFKTRVARESSNIDRGWSRCLTAFEIRDEIDILVWRFFCNCVCLLGSEDEYVTLRPSWAAAMARTFQQQWRPLRWNDGLGISTMDFKSLLQKAAEYTFPGTRVNEEPLTFYWSVLFIWECHFNFKFVFQIRENALPILTLTDVPITWFFLSRKESYIDPSKVVWIRWKWHFQGCCVWVHLERCSEAGSQRV